MNFLLETLRLGLANLGLHKLRSLLTALGIIFGVAAVITMVAIGEGNKRRALADIQKLGARNIIVRSVKPAEPKGGASSGSGGGAFGRMLSYGIKRADLRQIEATVSPIRRIVPLKEVAISVFRGEKRSPAAVFGTLPDLQDITSLRVARGRYITAADVNKPVCVIGAEVADRLFPLEDPLSGTIRVEGQVLDVIGVLNRVGLAGGSGSALVGRDFNFDIHIPLSTANSRYGDKNVTRQAGAFEAKELELSEVYIEVASERDVLAVAEQVKLVIESRHAKAGDATVVVPLELLEQAERTQRTFNLLMLFIAGISLLVGGIGIMNIMLASVTERIREIGIRRAIGATRKHIIAQFLVETTVLSFLGGIIGVVLGTVATACIELMRRAEWIEAIGQPHVPTWSILLSFAVSTLVGIGFGLYPAFQAARLDPIVALRHD